MVLICGIDEAGRGPVLGPMVVCGVLIEEKNEAKLLELGVKDSKLLSPKAREALFEQIKNTVKDYKVVIASPEEIDAYVDSDELNLNRLEAQKMAEIITFLKPDKAFLDCPSNNPLEFVAYLRRFIGKKEVELIAEHHAELKFPAVAAASIIAKVTRDREIEKLKKKLKVDFGSGYPSDEITQRFLKENWDRYPAIFRKSWASYKNVAEGKNQKRLGEF